MKRLVIERPAYSVGDRVRMISEIPVEVITAKSSKKYEAEESFIRSQVK
jgi:hypothetical protein